MTKVAPRLVEHPEEQLEKGKARFGAELVEHGALLGGRHPVQGIEAGEREVRRNHRLPEGPKSHQVLIELLLTSGRRQDAGARSGAHQDQRLRQALRGKLLGDDRPIE